jgi:hypothetical protein
MEPDWKKQFAKAQATRKANVICIKWGTRFGPEWVNRLYGMVRRNTTWDIRFVCFTDDTRGIRAEVECQPLPGMQFDASLGENYKNWRKLGLMREDLGGLRGMTLFFDLDVVIMGDLDPLFTHRGRFCIIREWKDPQLGYGNSSVVRYFIGAESQVLDRYHAATPEDIVGTYAGKEQNFMTKNVAQVTWWPASWCPAFNRTCLPRNRLLRLFATPRRPVDCKVLVFFGAITPESAMRGQHAARKPKRTLGLPASRRRFRSAAWLADYWRE